MYYNKQQTEFLRKLRIILRRKEQKHEAITLEEGRYVTRFTKYDYRKQIKMYEEGEEFVTHGRDEKLIHFSREGCN
jgi:hypothetical protein